MNIFVIDSNPRISAQHLVDRHVVKMILESAQILSNCFTLERLAELDCPRTQKGTVRKHSYPNHPCCKWVKESKFNMLWLINHAIAMDIERMERFKKDIPHFSTDFIKWCAINIDDSIVPDNIPTPFAQAMPKEYQNTDPVVAYRNYYREGKKHLHKWTRNKPSWIDL